MEMKRRSEDEETDLNLKTTIKERRKREEKRKTNDEGANQR